MLNRLSICHSTLLSYSLDPHSSRVLETNKARKQTPSWHSTAIKAITRVSDPHLLSPSPSSQYRPRIVTFTLICADFRQLIHSFTNLYSEVLTTRSIGTTYLGSPFV